MTDALRLVVFDVDGTLVDSQADIVAATTRAFQAVGHPIPARDAVLRIVGLSLDVAMERLAPGLDPEDYDEMIGAYRNAYMELRRAKGSAESSPLYPGAREVLEVLTARDDILLGLATGKSRRGLDLLIEGHGLGGVFVTSQVSDLHPSKPNPAMLRAALDETGVAAERAVMIGDTSYDMEMAVAAGVPGLGVSWGYHAAEVLAGAGAKGVLETFNELPAALDELWETAQ